MNFQLAQLPFIQNSTNLINKARYLDIEGPPPKLHSSKPNSDKFEISEKIDIRVLPPPTSFSKNYIKRN